MLLRDKTYSGGVEDILLRRLSLIIMLYLIINFYLGWHGSILWRYIGEGELSLALYWILFTIVAFSYLLGRIRLLPKPVNRLLKVIGSYYFALLEFAFILLPFIDLAAWLMKLSGVQASNYIPILGLIAAIVLAILLLWGSRNAWTPIKRTYNLHINKKAIAHEQLRVAVVSDIHLGNLVGNRHLKRLVTMVEGMNPDLILLVGDVIDDDIEPFIRNRMSEMMKKLKAPLGVYAVLGNHEYYGGHIEEFVKQMNAIDIKVLRDESVLVNGEFYVVGRKDKTAQSADPGGRRTMDELLTELDLSLPVIVMDHQPYQFDKAAAAGADILLSGHTHRGQFAPNHWVTRRLFELDWGYLKKENLHVVVSSGFGTWGPPIRIASRSEVVELVVSFQK
jgi:predicted MPP superfamily phosphohydrolase